MATSSTATTIRNVGLNTSNSLQLRISSTRVDKAVQVHKSNKPLGIIFGNKLLMRNATEKQTNARFSRDLPGVVRLATSTGVKVNVEFCDP